MGMGIDSGNLDPEKKYKIMAKGIDNSLYIGRDELLPAVSHHFASMPVKETETIAHFLYAVHNKGNEELLFLFSVLFFD